MSRPKIIEKVQPLKITCPFCSAQMIYRYPHDFWECVSCGSEFWPGGQDIRAIFKEEMLEKKRYRRKRIRERKKPTHRAVGTVSERIRFEVLKRDNFRCVYCGRTPSEDGVKLEVDHIIPAVEGGRYAKDNLVTVCRECNRGKGSTLLK